MKFKIYASIAIALILSACSSGRFGSFVQSPDVEAVIITDAVDKLQAEFPPANTVFFLGVNPKNTFHSQLDQALRERGFATAEQKEEISNSLNYVIDQVYADTYRIVLYVNNIPYSRAYKKIEDGKIIPIGTWAKLGE